VSFPVILPESLQESGETGGPIPRWMLATSVVSIIFSIAVYAVIYVQVPAFESLFRGFGGDLPLLTRIVFASYKWYGAFALVGGVPTYYLFRNRRCFVGDMNRLFVPVIGNIGLALFLLGAATAAMYLPVLPVSPVTQ
jgi:hypothetical protein